MEVVVDRKRCQGHGLCALYAPDIFVLDHTGFCVPGYRSVPPQFESAAGNAIASCPERAISWRGTDSDRP